MENCRDFESEGICREGVGCKYHHDYSRSLRANHLRLYFDTIVSDLNGIRDDIQDIKDKQTSLAASLSHLSDKVGKIKRTDDEISALTTTVADLVDKLKDAGISQLHFDLQPAVPAAGVSKSDASLSSRVQNYMKPKRGGNKGGRREHSGNPKKK